LVPKQHVLGFGCVFQFTQYYDDYGDSVNKIPMLERFAAQSLVEHEGELIFSKEKFAELIVRRTLDIVEAHTEIFQSDESRAMVEHIKQSVKTDFGVEE
jgi:hypothetical protein